MSDITLQVTYPVGVDVMWKAIADPDVFGRWCMPEKGFQLQEGQGFTLESKPNRFWDGVFVCRIEEFHEGSQLRYTHKNAGLRLDGVVEWTITGDQASSTLTLHQTGFDGLRGVFYKALLGAGWRQMLRKNLPRELGIR